MFKPGIIQYSAGTTPSNGLLTNLVSYYKADTSGSFPDAHGSNDGTINGATYTGSGKINGAYDYDGVNDSISFANSIIPSGAKTMYCWIKTTDTGVQYLMGDCRVSGSANGTFLWMASGLVHFDMANGSSIVGLTGTTSIADGDWHLILATWDGTTGTNKVELYIDNVLEVSGTASTTSETTPDANLGIGHSPTGTAYPFDGNLDEHYIGGRVFDATDRANVWGSGSGLSYDSFTS